MNHSVDDYSECDTVITSLIQLKDGSGVSSSQQSSQTLPVMLRMLVRSTTCFHFRSSQALT
jgi:hypothetical protein